MSSAWGSAFGSAWGTAFGDSIGAPHVITGTGAADQVAAQSFGSGNIPGAIVARVAPDNHPGGVPSTRFKEDSARRLGFILSGVGAAEQEHGQAQGQAEIPKTVLAGIGAAEQALATSNGEGRIRRAVLMATCAVADSGSGSAGQSGATFVDVELEQFAVLAAVAANEWRMAA